MIGLPAALRLVDRFGGICVYVPHPGRVVAHGKVAEVIGVEAMRRLAETWGPDHVMVPVGAAYMRAQRDRAIHADRAALSLSELARKYEMTERNVLLVLKRPAPELAGAAAAPGSQGQLF